jgi:hypothetical protein
LSFALSRCAVVPLDIGANKLTACALVERLSWRDRLGLFIDRVGRFCCSRRLEADIPFEIAQRALFFACLKLVVCNESCTTFLPNFSTRSRGTRRR